MKTLWELEISTDIKERQEYVKKLRERIKQSEAQLINIDPWGGLDREMFTRLARSEDQNISKLAEEILINMDESYDESLNAKMIEHERSFIRMLKSKLDNFEVYNQKIKYTCARCKESKDHCICDEM